MENIQEIQGIWFLIALVVVSFIQNLFFTAVGSVTMMHFMLKKAKGKLKVGDEKYELHPSHSILIHDLTHDFNNKPLFDRTAINHALLKQNGNIDATLKYLYEEYT